MRDQILRNFDVTRFEYRLDRVIGDSQVRFDTMHAVALELTDAAGRTGLGFGHKMFEPFAPQSELTRVFGDRIWPNLDGRVPAALTHQVVRPRGGNRRDAYYGFDEALQIALWDLAAQQAGLPLADYLGATRRSVPAYASGLDFQMDDAAFTAFFAKAAALGFTAFKIKIGSADPAWDLHRLDLLRQTVGPGAGIMADANEAWSPKQAMVRLTMIRDAGFDLIWIEDPILRDDFDGLRALRNAVSWTQINSGEYLDLSGRRRLLQENATDILNVHGRITDVMRIGWLAADMGVPVSLGNTFLETGVHAACALPEVPWMEYSFLNTDHLIDEPVRIRNGHAHVGDRPGLGFSLSQDARTIWSAPEPSDKDRIQVAPSCRLLTETRGEFAQKHTDDLTYKREEIQ